MTHEEDIIGHYLKGQIISVIDQYGAFRVGTMFHQSFDDYNVQRVIDQMKHDRLIAEISPYSWKKKYKVFIAGLKFNDFI